MSPPRSPSKQRMTQQQTNSDPSVGEVSCQLDAIDIYVRGSRKRLTGEHFLKLRYRPSERTLYAGHNWCLQLKEIEDIKYDHPHTNSNTNGNDRNGNSSDSVFHIVTNTGKQWQGEIFSDGANACANPRVRQQKETQLAEFHFLIEKVVRQWTRVHEKKQKQQSTIGGRPIVRRTTTNANNNSQQATRSSFAANHKRRSTSGAHGGVLASVTALPRPAVVSASKQPPHHPLAAQRRERTKRAAASTTTKTKAAARTARGRTIKKPPQTELDFVFASDSDADADDDKKDDKDQDRNKNNNDDVNAAAKEAASLLPTTEEERTRRQGGSPLPLPSPSSSENDNMEGGGGGDTKEEEEEQEQAATSFADMEEDDDDQDSIGPRMKQKTSRISSKRHRNLFVDSDDDDDDDDLFDDNDEKCCHTNKEEEHELDATVTDNNLSNNDANEHKSSSSKTSSTCGSRSPFLLTKSKKIDCSRSKRRVLTEEEENVNDLKEEDEDDISTEEAKASSASSPPKREDDTATPSPKPTSTRVEREPIALTADLSSTMTEVVSEDEGGGKETQTPSPSTLSTKQANKASKKVMDLTNFFAPRGAAAKKKQGNANTSAITATAAAFTQTPVGVVQEKETTGSTTNERERVTQRERAIQSPPSTPTRPATTTEREDTEMEDASFPALDNIGTPIKKIETQTRTGNASPCPSASAYLSPSRTRNDACSPASLLLLSPPSRESKRSSGAAAASAGIKRRQQYGRGRPSKPHQTDRDRDRDTTNRAFWSSPSRRQELTNAFSPAKQLTMVAMASNNGWESSTKQARKSPASTLTSHHRSSSKKTLRRTLLPQEEGQEEVVVRPLNMALFGDSASDDDDQEDDDKESISVSISISNHSEAATEVMEDPAAEEHQDEQTCTPLLSCSQTNTAQTKDTVPLLSLMFAKQHKANMKRDNANNNANAASSTSSKRPSLVRPRLKALSPKRNLFSTATATATTLTSQLPSRTSPRHKGTLLPSSLSLSAASNKTSALTSVLSPSSSVSPAVVPKPLKMVGLRNMGNSCYLNAALQMFMSLSLFSSSSSNDDSTITRAGHGHHGFITDLESFYERSVSKAISKQHDDDNDVEVEYEASQMAAANKDDNHNHNNNNTPATGNKEGTRPTATTAISADASTVAKGVLPLHRALVAVCFALQRHRQPPASLWYGDNPANVSASGNIASAFQVKRAMDALTATYAGHDQHDSHEFVLDLLDLLQQEEESESLAAASDAEEATGAGGNQEIARASTTPLLRNKSSNDDNNTNSTIRIGATGSSKTVTVPTSTKSPCPFSSPPAAAAPVDHYFTCEVEICLTCSECGYARTQTVSDRHLSLDLISASATKQGTNGENANFGVFQGLQNYFESDLVSIACEKKGCNGSSCRRDQRIKKL
jgi:hypothetical protein